MTCPKVSCLMPTYNRAWKDPGMIGEAIWWFLQQDYPGPRELVVLVDAPGARLEVQPVPGVGDHLIRVLSYTQRFPDLASKFDELVMQAEGDILLPWEDDDVSLPHRITQAVGQLELHGVDYWNPKGAYFQPGNDKLSFCRRDSVHHNASAYTREGWEKTGGYRLGVGMGNKQDAYMDQAMRRFCRVWDGYLPPDDMSYVYRWFHSPQCRHLSSHPNPDVGWALEQPPTGTATVTPTMLRDYAVESAALALSGYTPEQQYANG